MGGALRFVIIGLIGLLAFKFFSGSSAPPAAQPLTQEPRTTPAKREPYTYCSIKTETFAATLTSRGGTLKHFRLSLPKYQKGDGDSDLSTTPHPGIALGDPRVDDPAAPGIHEFRQQLFSSWRNPTRVGATPIEDEQWNVAFDSFDYKVAQRGPTECEFTYEDAAVRIVKRVAATSRPYELRVVSELTNLSDQPRSHAYAIDTVAWRLNSEVEGKMFRVSPYITQVECVPQEGDARHLLPKDFEPDSFEDSERFRVAAPWGFYELRDPPDVAAVSNAYFTQSLASVSAPSTPRCQVLIENHFEGRRASAPGSGSFYRARLAYPQATLGPSGTARYENLSYIGPKEREVLTAAGGKNHRFEELIDLGFFSVIAKVLVSFLLGVHGVIPNWGVAIIVLTLTARVLLFPLSWPGIVNMVRMRELKPELDALTEKFKSDPQAKGLAQMELYRKHKVNIFKGCLPQLASMPVWLALYRTLQTAVELYNIPFLWFPDLSEPDPYFVLPAIIGATYFLQQKLMPMQGGDPAQQKLMMYMMPGMFTVFMLFLPSGLGVYMFTNSVLAIAQQQVVEWRVRKSAARARSVGQAKAEGKASV